MAHDCAEKIMQLHHMGLSVTEIAREIYVAKEQVARVIEEHGERPTTSGQRRVKAARIRYEQDILTPLERRRKALTMSKSLSKEKIGEVQALIESGAKKADIIEQTGVSASTVDRIRSGQLTAEGKPDKPAPQTSPAQVFTALETAPDALSVKDTRILRSLTEQVLRALAGVEGETDADSQNLGQAYGLLTAVQLILGGGAE